MTVKKLLLTFILLCFITVISAQSCPSEIQNSSTTQIRFKVEPGFCGDYDNSQTITVYDEFGDMSTYSLDRCRGVNLDYNFTSGTQPSDVLNITVDFGSGVVCTYADGTLQTLGLEDHPAGYYVTIGFDNPITKDNLIISSRKSLNGDLQIFDLKGAKIYEAEVSNARSHQVNTSNWSNGTYIIKLQAQFDGWVKKIAF